MKNVEKLYSVALASTVIVLFLILISSTVSAAAQSASPAATYAYITQEDGTVSVIDTATNNLTATVNVGGSLSGITVTPDGTKVYVANNVNHTVSVIDTATNKVTAMVPVGTQPEGVAVTPDGKKVYVANNVVYTVSVIDTATNTVIANVDVRETVPYGVVVTPDGKKVYVTNGDLDFSGKMSIIDTTTDTVTATVDVGDFSGAAGSEVAIAPDGTKLYMTTTGGSIVSVIDTATNAVTATVPVWNSYGVVVNPDGKKVYVVNSYNNTVDVIDTATNTVIENVPVGINPYGIAITPDGKKVYVANRGTINNPSKTVSVIDTATNTVLNVTVGDVPRRIAVGPAPGPVTDGYLVQVEGSLDVYLIENGTKHRFTSPEALEWNGYSFDNVTYITSEKLQSYPDGGDISISQPIIDKYHALGGAPIFGASSGEGEKIGDQDSAGTYCSYVNFENGSIEYFQNGDLKGQAYAIFNPFLTKWASMGYAKSVLGYPIDNMSNEETSKFGTKFRYQNFANGTEKGALEYNLTSGNVFEIHGAIFAKWGALGYANSELGLVTSDERDAVPSFKGTTGRVNDFENGHLHWHGSGDHYMNTYMTYGDLDKFYINMGGTASDLGFPITDQQEGEKDSAGTYCSYVNFENGSIEHFENGDLAGKVCAVFNPFFNKWASMGYSKSVLGYPIDNMSDVQTSKFGTKFRYQNFANGTEKGALEYNITSGNVFVVHGPIFEKWGDLGYAQSDLGLPITDQQDGEKDSAGTYCSYVNFENGSIECFQNGNLKGRAYAIFNPFYTKWASMGYAKSVLGYPIDNMSDVQTSKFGTPFKYQNFANGTEKGALEYNITSEKVFKIHGIIFEKWGTIGYAQSDLGLPIMDQENKSGHWYCEFEGGSIGWDDSTRAYKVKTWTATPLFGKIAFASFRDQNQEIYVINADGNGDPIKLTNSPDADDGDPTWSPDGKQIAFSSNQSGNWKTYVMNADDGSEQVCLLEDVYDAWGPAWSPDGKKIALACKIKSSDDFDIYTLDAQSRVLTQVTDNSYDDCHPSWSPDSHKIVFTSNRDGNQEIYIADILAGTQTKITDEPENDDYPEWSPDGSMIAFMSERDGNSEIYKMDLASKAVTRLTYSNSIDKHAQWSPDSQNIVFISDRDGGDMDIYVMKSDGTGIDCLVDWEGDETHPTWSPDQPSPTAYSVGQGASTPEITQKFVEAYNRNGGLSVLGNPTTKVHYAFGFEVQDFPEMPETDGGVIMYNSSNSTAYFIHGAIWDKYYAYTDANKTRLGAIVSDEKDAIASPKGTVGRYTEFETGAIHWISDKDSENIGHLQRGQSFVTYGDLNKMYDEMGGTGSELGFPITDQETKTDGHDYCEFEGGSIGWDDSTGTYKVKLDQSESNTFLNIIGRVKYSDLHDMTLQPLAYAKIELDSDQDSINGILGSGNTKSDGSFDIKIKDEMNLDTLYVRIYADTSGSNVDKVVVHNVGSDEVFYYSTTIPKSTSFNEIAPSIDNGYDLNNDNIFRIYSKILNSYYYFSNYFDLEKVTVKLNNSAKTGSYTNSIITINFKKYSETHNDIELYHEYGHFVMDSSHGVLYNIPDSIYHCTDSSFDILEDIAPNSEYPWIEGWAIFLSATINGNEEIPAGEGITAYTINLENANSPFDITPYVWRYAPKSSMNPIRNAAFLWDMYDGKGGWDLTETYDQFDGGNSIKDILDIMTDEKTYYTPYGNNEKYKHQTPLNAQEFYDGWIESGKPQVKELNELAKHHFGSYIHLQALSPINVHLYDSNGNHIGVNETTGEIDKEIVGSYYSGPDSHPEEIFVIRGDDEQFSCVIKGEEDGTFTLEFENAENGTVVNTTYENIPVKKGSLGYLETNIEDEQHLLKMDFDGDSVIDESIAPTHIEINDNNENPPSSVANLQPTDGTTWINWTWQNPTDSDFNHTEIYLNNTFQTNTSAEYFNSTDLEPDTDYTISTRTVDNNGNVNETWVNSTATTLKAPIIVEAGSDQTVEEGATVNFEGNFTASGSHAYSYHWDFGDGSVEDSSLTTSHIYADDGAYTVSLAVTDEEGNFGNDTLLVTVNNAIPVVDSGSDLEITAGDPVSFTGTFSDPGWLDTHTTEWNFGEGTVEAGSVSEENEYPNSTGTVSGNFSYFDAGEYTSTLSVTDDDGGIGQDQLTVTVRPIKAEVTFDPETFSLNSTGDWVTAYIELPAGYSVSGIDIGSVLLNGTVHAVSDPKYDFVTNESEYLTDIDLDGISERMFKFNRAEVAGILKAGDQVTVTFTGKVEYNNGISSGRASFEGSDVIRVTESKNKK